MHCITLYDLSLRNYFAVYICYVCYIFKQLVRLPPGVLQSFLANAFFTDLWQ